MRIYVRRVAPLLSGLVISLPLLMGASESQAVIGKLTQLGRAAQYYYTHRQDQQPTPRPVYEQKGLKKKPELVVDARELYTPLPSYATTRGWGVFKSILYYLAAKNTPLRQGRKVFISLADDDDITTAVDYFVEPVKRDSVAAQLKHELAASPNAEGLRIGLERLLPPGTKDRLYSYACEDGPNCFASAVDFHSPYTAPGPGHYLGPQAFMGRLYGQFTRLPDEAALQSGDVLVYWDSVEQEPVHASIWLAENLVFTKNGYSCQNPYLFQEQHRNEELYAADKSIVRWHYRFKGREPQPSPQAKSEARLSELLRQMPCGGEG